MDHEIASIQNEFFNAVRKDRVLVTVFLLNGKRLVGRIRSFDKFTVLLDNHHGEQIVFKHAISTVALARHPATESEDYGAREPVGADQRDEG